MTTIEEKLTGHKIAVYKNEVLIAAGTIINFKQVPIKCFTFDNKYFFSLSSKNLKYVEESVNNKSLEDTKDVLPWSTVYANRFADIYRDFNELELDEEVKDLVFILNQRKDIRTIGSCSGHNRKYAYIDLAFSSFKSLYDFVKILENKFNKCFVLTTCSNLKGFSEEIFLQLQTKTKGTKAYRDIKRLAKYLNEVQNVGKN